MGLEVDPYVERPVLTGTAPQWSDELLRAWVRMSKRGLVSHDQMDAHVQALEDHGIKLTVRAGGMESARILVEEALARQLSGPMRQVERLGVRLGEIEGWLLDDGWLEGAVVGVRVVRPEREVVAEVTLQAGERFVIEHAALLDVIVDRLRDEVRAWWAEKGLNVGEVARRGRIVDVVSELTRKYRDAGYMEVEVRPRVSLQRGHAAILIEVTRGEVVVWDEVKVEGVVGGIPVGWKTWLPKRGEPGSERALVEAKRRMEQATGRAVAVSTLGAGPRRLRVVFEVGRLRAGGAVDIAG